MKVIKAPAPIEIDGLAVFLAGSIEMGKAVDWQRHVERELQDVHGTIFNPRRDDWDSSWGQSIENAPFREHVKWELWALNSADVIAMYFAPETLGPISLLELGLFAPPGKMIVCCSDGFWRKGNVDIVCHHYGVQQAQSLSGLVARLKKLAYPRASGRRGSVR